MPIPAQRTINPEIVRNFGRFGDAVEVPPLTEVQTRSYDRFLQLDVSPEKRILMGLEGVLQEIFPIESYDKTLSLQYLKYELGKPRYGPDECRQLRLTYGRPFRVWLRLNKEQPVEAAANLSSTAPNELWLASFTAPRVSISSSKPKPASASCIAAGLFPNGAAGLNSM
jgi:DNA-directed RNA polymerase beta subunit